MSAHAPFWKTFFDEFYEKRPTVLDLTPLNGAPFTEEQAAHVVRTAFSRTHGRTYVPEERRFHIDSVPVNEPYIDDKDLPRDDEGVGAFLERIYRTVGAKDLTLVAHNCHQFAPSIFFSARSFFKPLFDMAGVPSFMVGTDLFAGKYMTAINQVHKDMGAVFIFPLISKKSIICWPFEHFAHLKPDSHFTNAGLLGIRAEDHEDSATILTATPGQAIYFPAHWWHAAYSHDREATCTLNVTLYLSSTIEGLVMPVARHLLKQLDQQSARVDHIASLSATDRVLRLEDVELPQELVGIGDRLERAIRLQLLKRVSASGFVTGLCNFDDNPSSDDLFRGDHDFGIFAIKDGTRELIVSNGCVFECPHTSEVMETIRLVNSGVPFAATDLPEPDLFSVLTACGSIRPNQHTSDGHRRP